MQSSQYTSSPLASLSITIINDIGRFDFTNLAEDSLQVFLGHGVVQTTDEDAIW